MNTTAQQKDGSWKPAISLPYYGLRKKCQLNHLARDNNNLRKAGNELARAAIYVADQYDGVHRLMKATSKWCEAVANEGGRNL